MRTALPNITAPAILLALLLPAAAISASEIQHIYLRNGQVISGRVVSQNANKVWIRIERRVIVVSKSRIRRIAYDTPLEQQHVRELRRQKSATSAAYNRRLQEELRKARAEWERERQTEQRQEQQVRERKAEVRAREVKAGSLWRSLVAPGWGQHNRGEVGKGYIFGGLFAGSLFLWYRADQDFRDANKAYSSTTIGLSALVLAERNTASIVGSLVIAQTANDAKRVAATEASILQTLVFGLYFVNVIDAILFEGRALRPPPAKTAGPHFFLHASARHASAGITIRF